MTHDPSEFWRPITGFPGYAVSSQGRVRSLPGGHRKGAILAQSRTRKYLCVNIYRDGRAVRRYVHLLVLEAFVGPRPEGMEGCHKDDDANRNMVSNLEWGTHVHNVYQSVANGRHHHSRRTHCANDHEFTPENTLIRTDGGRRCLTCKRERERKS